jgi:large subunit ribosomal protein L13
MRTTYMAKPLEVERKWHLIDAEGKTLGRLASEAAALLRGKHKPEFTPHIDTGDFVIVINAEKIHLTGRKLQQKKYYTHSHYPGGLKTTTAAEMINKKPHRIIELAVYGMLPKNKLGDSIQTHLKVYAGSKHPHQAQQPEVYELRG